MRKSRTFFAIGNLLPPFARVLEKSFLVTPQGHSVNSSCAKIVFFLQGHGLHQFEGAGEAPVGPGDILVVPSPVRQFYRSHAKQEHIHAVSLVFDRPLFPACPGEPDSEAGEGGKIGAETRIVAFCRQYFRGNCHVRDAVTPEMREALLHLRSEAQQLRTGNAMVISSQCANLAVLCARMLSRENAASRNQCRAQAGSFLARRAKEYLHSNSQAQLRLGHVAAHLQVSEEHLARTFREATGTSVFAYLRALRLEDAMIRLVNSEENITEIAQHSGFTSLALFSRSFKSYTGLSPLQYRREFGGESPP